MDQLSMDCTNLLSFKYILLTCIMIIIVLNYTNMWIHKFVNIYIP